MTRILKLRMLGMVYFGAMVDLFLVGSLQMYDATTDPATGTFLMPILTLGVATLLIIPAWSLWVGARRGWITAFPCFFLFLLLTMDHSFTAVVCISMMMLLGLYETAPRRHRPGSTLTDLDRLASILGMNWRDTPFSQIGDFLQTGKFDAAAKLYREAAKVTWDSAWSAVGDWENNEVECKLRFLLRHLETYPISVARGEMASPN